MKFNQVWICLAVSMIMMASALTYMTRFYKKYIKIDNIGDETSTIMDFDSFVQSNMYLWSHLTKNRMKLENDCTDKLI